MLNGNGSGSFVNICCKIFILNRAKSEPALETDKKVTSVYLGHVVKKTAALSPKKYGEKKTQNNRNQVMTDPCKKLSGSATQNAINKKKYECPIGTALRIWNEFDRIRIRSE